MPELIWLNHIPPLFISLLVIPFAFLWQYSGYCLLSKISKYFLIQNINQKNILFQINWLCWPFLSGAAVLLMLLMGVGTRWLFIVLALGILSIGLVNLVQIASKDIKNRAKEFLNFKEQNKKYFYFNVLCFLGILLLGIFAAHPQRQFDQLNYHLPLSKLIINSGLGSLAEIFRNSFDFHIRMTGIFEYALVLPRALFNHDLFQVAFAQFWIFILSIPFLLSSLKFFNSIQSDSDKKQRSKLLIGFLFVILIFFPNSESLRIVKPDIFMFFFTLLALEIMYQDRKSVV